MQGIEIKNNSFLNLSRFSRKLGWQDSNLRMAESKSTALPLGDTPKIIVKLIDYTI
jgi:hypothetical protein